MEKALQPCGTRENECRYIDIDNKLKRSSSSCTMGTQTELELSPSKRAKLSCVENETQTELMDLKPQVPLVDLTGDCDPSTASSSSSSDDPRERLLSNLMLGPHADDVCMLWRECSNEYLSHTDFLATVVAQFGG